MFVYQVYDNNSNIRLVYKKVVGEDPVLLDTVNDCCYTPMLIDNKLIFIWQDGVADVIDGNLTNRRYFGIVLELIMKTSIFIIMKYMP